MSERKVLPSNNDKNLADG